MIALLYLIFFFGIYFPISFWVVRKSYRFAEEKYSRGWMGGTMAAFVMYNLVFWDWIPVMLIHKHLCETEGGFWVYKTPEQWVKEHPGVVGQDWSNSRTESIRKEFGNTLYRYWYGSVAYREIAQHSGIDLTKTIYRREINIVDAKTNEILFRSVNFSPIAPYKFWLSESGKGGRFGCSELAENGAENELDKLRILVKGDKQ